MDRSLNERTGIDESMGNQYRKEAEG